MYHKVMVPVDLAHTERLEKALLTAADLAKHYDIPICYVGVTSVTPGTAAHDPEEFARKLEAFTQEQQHAHGLEASMTAYTAHDPAVELETTLMRALDACGADLVVMASHVPGLVDHVFAAHSTYVASHAKVSVFVVR